MNVAFDLSRPLDLIAALAPDIVVMIGGMGSFVGSAVGSLLVAATQTFGNFYFPDLALVITYLLMIGVLLYRPGGLFGEEE